MTALKPLENRRVRAVASERYPLNEFCASPMSDAGVKADDPHHCFPRSQIGGDSWFVEITYPNTLAPPGPDVPFTEVIPHVVGLSREQHERVERHEAWIKLEDGVWNWYERENERDPSFEGALVDPLNPEFGNRWTLIGPLNPQPGSREGKPKRRKFKGEKRRKRTTISIRVPQDDLEDGAGIWDDLMEQAAVKLREQMELDYEPAPYKLLTAVLYEYITS
jgi:hypothetical protein